jgi:cytochrome c553
MMKTMSAGLLVAGACAGLLQAGVASGAGARSDELRRALQATPDLAHGTQLFAGCVACHGSDGAGEANGTVPRIAGQHAAVLIKELVDFRNRRRWDLRMEQVAGGHRLTDAQDVADVAGYVARLRPDLLTATGSGEYLQRGASAYVRVCAGCHGASGQGSSVNAVPRLAGQHAPYLLRQMQESATNGRPNMAASHVEALRSFSYEDFSGAADYLSRIAVRMVPSTAE